MVAQQTEHANIAADLKRSETTGVPELELALKRRRAALQRALEEKERNELDMHVVSVSICSCGFLRCLLTLSAFLVLIG